MSAHVLRIYRSQLDYLLEGDFIWQPYHEDELTELPAYCLSGREIWNATVPLINFDVIELHAPDRVMRQFGLYQSMPQDIDTGSTLHRTDHRGRAGEKWAQKYYTFIEWWQEAEECICKAVTDSTLIPYHSPYMQWYFRITRLLIGNPSHRLNQGMQPFGALVEYWGQCLTQLHGSLDEVLENLHMDDYLIESKLLNMRNMCSRALDLAGETRRLQNTYGRVTTSRPTQGETSSSRSAQGRAYTSTHGHGVPSTSAHNQEGHQYVSDNNDTYFSGYTVQQGADLSHCRASTTHSMHAEGYTRTESESLGQSLVRGEQTPQQHTFQAFDRHNSSNSTHLPTIVYKRRTAAAYNEDNPRRLSFHVEPQPNAQKPKRKQPSRMRNPPPCGTGGCL